MLQLSWTLGGKAWFKKKILEGSLERLAPPLRTLTALPEDPKVLFHVPTPMAALRCV